MQSKVFCTLDVKSWLIKGSVDETKETKCAPLLFGICYHQYNALTALLVVKDKQGQSRIDWNWQR